MDINYKEKNIKQHNTEKEQKTYFKWMENQAKIYALLNLDLEELKKWYFLQTKKSWNSSNFIQLVKETSFENIIKYIKKVI